MCLFIIFSTKTKRIHDEYGCVEFKPNIANEEEQRQIALQLHTKFMIKEEDMYSLTNMSQSTFPLQRHLIIQWCESFETFEKMLDLWPPFRKKRYILLHFSRLMGWSIYGLADNYDEVAKDFVDFIKAKVSL
jgi:hypothetical protein